MVDRLAVLIVEHKASDDSRIGNPCREPSGRMSIDLEFAIMPWSQATQGLAIAVASGSVDNRSMDRPELADFLCRRREALHPEDVGLSSGPRRRVTGLRREEVATLASMSTDYYSRLEQQRGPQPSEPMLAAIARGLRLTQAERDHLFGLAGHTAPSIGQRSDHPQPSADARPGPTRHALR